MLTSNASSEAWKRSSRTPNVRPSRADATASTPSATSVRRRSRRTVARACCPAERPVGSPIACIYVPSSVRLARTLERAARRRRVGGSACREVARRRMVVRGSPPAGSRAHARPQRSGNLPARPKAALPARRQHSCARATPSARRSRRARSIKSMDAPMNLADHQSPPADVSLLLRAHAEARWLSREVVPVIRELERDLGSGAALAYLEALRIEAHHHAGETDAARGQLDALAPRGDHGVRSNAHRYHAAVRELRARIDARIQQLL